MATLHVLRVFTAADGTGGNPLGVFLTGEDVPGDALRQEVARDLGFAETVFVDDPGGAIRIFAPDMEMPFAGHPTVGAAWLLRREHEPVTALRVPAGEVAVRYEGELAWVTGRPEWGPPFEHAELGSPAEVDALPVQSHLAYCWAWEDEAAATVRARSFVPDAGIAEDEATGSAALALAARVGRAIQVRQGAGSELFARPLEGGLAEVGGRVVLDEARDYTVESR